MNAKPLIFNQFFIPSSSKN